MIDLRALVTEVARYEQRMREMSSELRASGYPYSFSVAYEAAEQLRALTQQLQDDGKFMPGNVLRGEVLKSTTEHA